MQRVKFQSQDGDLFYKSLRKRVNQYFKENNIKKTGNTSMYVKTVVLFFMFFTPYIAFYVLPELPVYLFIGLWVVIGLATAGLGFSVMHDAVHGSYSRKTKFNNKLGHFTMLFIGGTVANWKIQHNQLHHTFTNVDGLDDDIKPPVPFLRFSPYSPKSVVHRFQHVYAWFFYGLLSLVWTTTSEFKQILRYKSRGFYNNRKKEYKGVFSWIVISRILYFTMYIVLPSIFTPYSFWMVLLGFLSMHFVIGVIISTVFQSAHVSPDTTFRTSEKGENIPLSWAEHQLFTTQNFAMTNRLLSWYIGGLNFQIEHHLFPNICHIHYKNLSPIVQEVVAKFDLPYITKPTFRSVVVDHGKMLYQLGR
ncbi:MAG: acyl-CoA desaturase [Crocinitomicaceae bacterium]|nr:acyl-CoA desaturase [Crocinitomicaceae bacterium]|tara:strand:+ start:235 stop:1320 length:1086 start_codon:yes stop_codon:yes gene_type:complete